VAEKFPGRLGMGEASKTKGGHIGSRADLTLLKQKNAVNVAQTEARWDTWQNPNERGGKGDLVV